MPPAIERMQQTHRFFFLITGTSLHNGADQYLDQTSADSIDHNGDQQTDKGARIQIWQNYQADQTCC